MANTIAVIDSMADIPANGLWYRINGIVPTTYVKWVIDRNQWVKLIVPAEGYPSREYISIADWNAFLTLNQLSKHNNSEI